MPSRLLIVLDEAYVEYIRDGLLPDSFGLVRAHRNVIVLRTFSKAYGLAGLRIGYAVATRTSSPRSARSTCRSPRPACRRPRRSRRWTPPTNCWLAPTPSSPNAPGSAPPCARPATTAAVPGQLRLAAAARARRRLRRQAAANSRILVRPYGADGVRVTVAARRERRLPGVRRRLDRRQMSRERRQHRVTPIERVRSSRGRRAGDAVPADRPSPFMIGEGQVLMAAQPLRRPTPTVVSSSPSATATA